MHATTMTASTVCCAVAYVHVPSTKFFAIMLWCGGQHPLCNSMSHVSCDLLIIQVLTDTDCSCIQDAHTCSRVCAYPLRWLCLSGALAFCCALSIHTLHRHVHFNCCIQELIASRGRTRAPQALDSRPPSRPGTFSCAAASGATVEHLHVVISKQQHYPRYETDDL